MKNDDRARQRWLALGGIAIASFLGCIDFTIVNTAIPAIGGELHAGVGALQWIVTAFVTALSACMVAAGRLADRFGRRRLLYAGMLLFGAASLGAGLADTVAVLVAWRVLQGVACAALYTTSAAIVAQAFPEHQRGRALGLLFAANGLGLAIGPVAGGLLIDWLGWRSVFLLNVPLLAAAFALCLRRVQESRGDAAGQHLDLAGLLLLSSGLPCVLLAISEGARWGWTAPPTLATGVSGLLLLLALMVVEHRAASPLLQLSLFANRAFLLASLANFALAFFYCAAFFLLPLYLGTVRGQGSSHIGWLLLPITAVMALVSPQAGRLADRYGTTPLLAAGFAWLALSALLQAGLTAISSWTLVVLALACMGVGWGCILGPATAAALASVPAPQAGMAMGTSWTLHNLGAALGLTLATMLFQSVGGNAQVLAGFQAVLWLLCAISLATLAVLLAALLAWPASERKSGAAAPSAGR